MICLNVKLEQSALEIRWFDDRYSHWSSHDLNGCIDRQRIRWSWRSDHLIAVNGARIRVWTWEPCDTDGCCSIALKSCLVSLRRIHRYKDICTVNEFDLLEVDLRVRSNLKPHTCLTVSSKTVNFESEGPRFLGDSVSLRFGGDWIASIVKAHSDVSNWACIDR